MAQRKRPRPVKKTRRASKKKSAPKKSAQKYWLKYSVIFACWTIVTGVMLGGWLWYDLPDLHKLAKSRRRPGISILDRHQNLILTSGDVYGQRVLIKHLPKHIPQAFMAIEDRRFYEHMGVDWRGLLRAINNNLFKTKGIQGGSTLTQQLAKNFLIQEGLYKPSNRSLKRKLQELVLTYYLEKTLSKDQIFSIYLNRIYLGTGVYGIESAAQKYFLKPARRLNHVQAACLAGMVKSPTRYIPTLKGVAARQRTKVVLQAMVDSKFMTPSQQKHFLGHEKNWFLPPTQKSSVRYFTDWVLSEVQRRLGTIQEDLVILTTLDPHWQREGERVLRHYMDENQSRNVTQGALFALSPRGEIRALIGGKNYWESPFNRVTQSRRQTGSLFKLFVYLAAFEKGYTPMTHISDRPFFWKNWKPKNYGWRSKGDIRLQTAFAYSVNTATVRLGSRVGPKNIIALAQRLGLRCPMTPDLSITLGSADASLYELTRAFAVIARNGKRTDPFCIQEVRNRQGRLLYKHTPSAPKVLISAKVAQNMQSLLRAVVAYGTGRRANISPFAAGKSGTTQKHKDALFVGYTDKMITGVWLGNDNQDPMVKITGGSGPGRIWTQFGKSLGP